MSDYKKNISTNSGMAASMYRVNLKRGKGQKINRRDYDYLIHQLKPIVAGVLSEREFVDPTNFEVWKIKLKKITDKAYLETGVRTDVLANFKILRELEGNLNSIGIKTLYSRLSPKLNTVSIDIDLLNPLLSAAIRDNVQHRKYFEQLDAGSYTGGRNSGSVDFYYYQLHEPEIRKHWKKEASISILDYLRQELSSEEDNYFSLNRYYQELTAMNIIIAFLDKAKSGGDDDKEALMELLLDLNLKIILAPKEAFKRVDALEDRVIVVKKSEPYKAIPEYYCDSKGKTHWAKLLVNEVYIWNNDVDRLELVTDSEQAIAIMDEAIKEGREKSRRAFDRVMK